MAANKVVTLGPVALTTTLTTDIWKPPTTTGGTGLPENVTNTYYLIRHIRIVNKTGSAATFSLWKGASAGNVAGTEIVGQATSVPANSNLDFYFSPGLRLDAADTNKVIVGGSGTATALTIEAEAEMGIS